MPSWCCVGRGLGGGYYDDLDDNDDGMGWDGKKTNDGEDDGDGDNSGRTGSAIVRQTTFQLRFSFLSFTFPYFILFYFSFLLIHFFRRRGSHGRQVTKAGPRF